MKKWLRKKLKMIEVTERKTIITEVIDGQVITREETEVITREVK